MAIKLLFYNILIPIHTLEEKVASLETILSWKRPWNVFHDDDLYHEGAMSPQDVETIVNFWEEHGLTSVVTENKQEKWQDFCVADMIDGPTLPCDWLEHEYIDLKNSNDSIVWLKGKQKGKTYGPTK
jgi:hypothetical protein